jgi:hypothetical protein
MALLFVQGFGKRQGVAVAVSDAEFHLAVFHRRELVGRRRGKVKLEEYCWPDTMRSFPPQYTKKPLLRSQDK